jgi:ribosomal protein S6--L-glutamate ligase
MPRPSKPFILGWEEWVTLPELGLGAIKAKVDTGARTSALHAFYVEPFGPARARKVRFGVHPLPRRSDVVVECTASLIGRREVRSSNGEIEQRYVIETPIRIGERQWRIEVTLANRNMMIYRMLLGRQAIPRDGLVAPSASFLQPKLHYKIYDHKEPAKEHGRAPKRR